MRIAVFGLGYVGCVTGACLARMGHDVCGLDISAEKVRMINEGKSPIMEKGLEPLVRQMVRRGRLRATLQADEAVPKSDLLLVCVGTPSRANGAANLDHVLRAVAEIRRALRKGSRFSTLAVRSTVPPGTMEGLVIPELERGSKRKAGRGFAVCFHPEFLREGSSLHDFFHPPRHVIGCHDSRDARLLAGLWKKIRAPLFICPLQVAEMVKYVDNAFHALKVSFANEIGSLSKRLGIDGQEVMRIFVEDRKLNISPLYLKPGFAFGGPCLPKDLRALRRMGQGHHVDLPLIAAILESNARHLRRATELALATGKKKIGVLGLVFKSETDDLRESPACRLVKHLLVAGREVRVFDPRVRHAELLGANRAFIDRELPQLPQLLVPSLDDLVDDSEVIVVAGTHPEFRRGLQNLRRGLILIDLVQAVPVRLTPQDIRTVSLC